MTNLISAAANNAAANNAAAAENAAAEVVLEADNYCGINTTKGKILSFFLSLPKGEKKSASDVLDETKLSNGEGSPVIRQLYVAGILSQECRRGKYSIAEGVLILKDSKIEKTEDGAQKVNPIYKWAGNRPIPGAENAFKKAKKSLTLLEKFELFREEFSVEIQTALKNQLDALEDGIKSEEEKAKKKAEEDAINAELEALERELEEKRAKLAALRGKKV